jgi:hypothetical protein
MRRRFWSAPRLPERHRCVELSRDAWASTSSAVLLLLVLVVPDAASAVEDYSDPEIEPLYLAESIGTDRLTQQYAPIPFNATWAIVRHMGDVGTPQLEQQIANRVLSDRSEKTGLTVPIHPFFGRGLYQRGYEDDPARGTNVYQIVDRSFGWHINTYQFDYEEGIECPIAFPECSGGPNIVYTRRFDPPLDPWPTPSSEFTLQVRMKMPWVHYETGTSGTPAAQVSFVYYLLHPSTGHLIAAIVNLFDTRPFDQVGWERVSDDGVTPFVSSDLRDLQPDGRAYRYVNRSPFSSRSANRWRWSGEKFFRAHVGVNQLQAIIDDTNSPGHYAEYRVIEALVLIEAFPRLTGDVSFAGSLRNFELYRFHDGD